MLFDQTCQSLKKTAVHRIYQSDILLKNRDQILPTGSIRVGHWTGIKTLWQVNKCLKKWYIHTFTSSQPLSKLGSLNIFFFSPIISSV